MRGKIITVEGLDGAGKSTQINLLTQKLNEMGIKHKFIHFPMLNQGVYGTLIAEFLRGEYGSLEEVHPKLVALLFAEDRNEHQHKIRQWLEEGYLVILDRYVQSNIAFQCAKLSDDAEKEQLKQWILEFEFEYNKLPKPSVSVFLNVPIEHIEKSLKNQRKGEDRTYLEGKIDIHEASIKFQKKVLVEYLKMLKENPGFYRIDCFSETGEWLAPETIHQSIMDKLNFLKQEKA